MTIKNILHEETQINLGLDMDTYILTKNSVLI